MEVFMSDSEDATQLAVNLHKRKLLITAVKWNRLLFQVSPAERESSIGALPLWVHCHVKTTSPVAAGLGSGETGKIPHDSPDAQSLDLGGKSWGMKQSNV